MSTKLPSSWQLGDKVQVVFTGNAILKDCRVVKVAFREHNREPLYDVEVPYEEGDYEETRAAEGGIRFFRIHAIPQWFLSYTQEDWDKMQVEEKAAS